jgi:hypothetical protein
MKCQQIGEVWITAVRDNNRKLCGVTSRVAVSAMTISVTPAVHSRCATPRYLERNFANEKVKHMLRLSNLQYQHLNL